MQNFFLYDNIKNNMYIFFFLFYTGNLFVSFSAPRSLEDFSIQLFHKNYFFPYYIQNDMEKHRINKICYELNKVITYYNMIIWGGSTYVSYNDLAKNIQILSYLYLFKVKDLQECFISYIINNKLTIEEIYHDKPILLYNDVEENLIWCLYTIKDLKQMKIIQMKKKIGVDIFGQQFNNLVTPQYQNLQFDQYQYEILSIREYDKVFLLGLFNKLILYNIGMMIKTQDLVDLKHAAINISLGDVIEYHILFYTPHDYGDCTTIVNFQDPCVIYFVFVINKNNIIENIKLKTQCCEKFDI
jgi:hypothetical protein